MPEHDVVTHSTRGADHVARGPITRVLGASLRLAAIYGVGVTVLLALVIVPQLLTTSAALRLRELAAVVSIPFLVAFGVAFLLLAMTRRFGFALAWLALLAVWIVALRSQPATLAPESFLLWSVLAAPLFAMVVIGVPASGSSGGRPLASTVMLAWLALFVGADVSLFLGGARNSPGTGAGFETALTIAGMVAPFVISAVALWRLRPLLTARGERAA